MGISGFIKRHPVSIYFALVFIISWGGVLIVVGPGGIPGTTEQTEILLPFVFLAMLAGPSLASILLNGIVDERDHLRDLFRLCRWSVNISWYGAALLITPLLLTTILLALTLIHLCSCPVSSRRTIKSHFCFYPSLQDSLQDLLRNSAGQDLS